MKRRASATLLTINWPNWMNSCRKRSRRTRDSKQSWYSPSHNECLWILVLFSRESTDTFCCICPFFYECFALKIKLNYWAVLERDQTRSKAVCEIHSLKSFMSRKLKLLCFLMFEKVADFVFLYLTLIKYHRKCWITYFFCRAFCWFCHSCNGQVWRMWRCCRRSWCKCRHWWTVWPVRGKKSLNVSKTTTSSCRRITLTQRWD